MDRPILDAEVAAAVRKNIEGGQFAPTGVPAAGFTLAQLGQLRDHAKTLDPPDEVLRANGRSLSWALAFEERFIPGPPGGPDIATLIIRPAVANGPLPALVITHCAGKVVSSNRLALDTFGVLDWAHEFGLVLVGLRIRPGPEHRHPAQVEDGYAGLQWVAANAESIGIDKDRIGLMGISGGGGIAAATALYARDRGGPRVSHQILLIPMLDDREITPSSKMEGVEWDRVSNRTGWRAILGDASGGPTVDEYAAPSRARTLNNLPPTYIDVYTGEVFRDEAIDCGARMAAAGVPVDMHVWAGGLHGGEILAPSAELSRAVRDARRSFIRRITRPSGTGFEPWPTTTLNR
jgi:acetyl esterase/lipase